MKKTKGVTLIEIVVSMGIFLTIMTIAVGAFIIIVRMRSLTSNMRDSQQKLRFATEKIARLSRQATRVTNTASQLDLLYKGENGGYRSLYTISSGELKERECVWVSPATDCVLNAEKDLLGGAVTLETSGPNPSRFIKSVAGPTPNLEIILNGKINGLAPYYADGFYLAPIVSLEGLK